MIRKVDKTNLSCYSNHGRFSRSSLVVPSGNIEVIKILSELVRVTRNPQRKEEKVEELWLYPWILRGTSIR